MTQPRGCRDVSTSQATPEWGWGLGAAHAAAAGGVHPCPALVTWVPQAGEERRGNVSKFDSPDFLPKRHFGWGLCAVGGLLVGKLFSRSSLSQMDGGGDRPKRGPKADAGVLVKCWT